MFSVTSETKWYWQQVRKHFLRTEQPLRDQLARKVGERKAGHQGLGQCGMWGGKSMAIMGFSFRRRLVSVRSMSPGLRPPEFESQVGCDLGQVT